VNTAKDIGDDIQLQARGYWWKIPHPELKDELTILRAPSPAE
jgi:hypothetical protein